MKLLQVNNVATLLGGTGQCALSIRHALPDFDHRVHYFGMGEIEPYIQEEFGPGVDLHIGTKISQEDLEWSDLVIFHNTAMVNMPSRIPENCATVYYQHSNHKSARFAGEQCDVALTVSNFLKRESRLDFEVLYQPVKQPRFRDGRHPGAGRVEVSMFCSPNPDKWGRALELFDVAFRQFRESCLFSFVGAPPHIERGLYELSMTHAAATDFMSPSVVAKSLMHTWDILLYSSDVVETYGRTICEAQMCGCVPIVDNKGGFVEQVRHGYDGFLCNSTSEFMNCIDDVIYDWQRGFEMSQKAEISGSQRGSLVTWRRKFLEILRGSK